MNIIQVAHNQALLSRLEGLYLKLYQMETYLAKAKTNQAKRKYLSQISNIRGQIYALEEKMI